jgi:hypothetical protein
LVSGGAHLAGEALDIVAVRDGALIGLQVGNFLQFPQAKCCAAYADDIPVVRTQALGQMTAYVSGRAKYDRCS